MLGDDEAPWWAPEELLPTWQPSQPRASPSTTGPKSSPSLRCAGTPAATADALGKTPRRASSSSPSAWHAARELARFALASLALCRLCLEAAHSLGTTRPVAGSLSGGCCQAARAVSDVLRLRTRGRSMYNDAARRLTARFRLAIARMQRECSTSECECGRWCCGGGDHPLGFLVVKSSAPGADLLQCSYRPPISCRMNVAKRRNNYSKRGL